LGAIFLNISYYQAIERVTFSNLISISRSITFVIIGLFTLPELIGVDGIWLTLPFADTMTCCCTATFNFFFRKNDKPVSLGI
jgi:Na+-driven multidrug efflux pump